MSTVEYFKKIERKIEEKNRMIISFFLFLFFFFQGNVDGEDADSPETLDWSEITEEQVCPNRIQDYVETFWIR